MNRARHSLSVFAGILLLCSLLSAQQAAVSTSAAAVVPRLVNFSGKAIDQGRTVTGVTGITFAIYSEETGGSPLWLETQNIQPDSRGNYTAQLGATKTEGLPLDLFTSGEARWLGARVNGGEEQARVLLLSVPYALKAADAQTLAGLPASAFMLAGTVAAGSNPSAAMSPAQVSAAAVSGTGTTDFLPLWTNSTGALGNSILFQSGTGTTAKMGINTTSPAATLDVNGAVNVHGTLNHTATGTATATAGKNSAAEDFTASVFNSTTATPVAQKFQWQAEPVGNNTATASGAMSLLYATGSAALAETGLKINSKGLLTFAAGQAFPGTGKGTVTSVGLSAPSSDFTVSGSPVTGSGTLTLKWNTAPTSADTANTIVKRDATGSFNATSITAVVSNGSAAVTGNDQSSGGSSGVFGNSTSGDGVYGQSGGGIGVQGLGGPSSFGVYGTGLTGVAGLSNGNYIGVYGSSSGSGSYGVFGLDSSGTGVYGSGTVGVSGISTDNAGVYAQSDTGWAVDALGTGSATGILAGSSTGWAAWFNGNVDVDGNLSKAGGSFKIDHPLDPSNKYLYHSFVESPDMKNIYDGVVTLDANGEAVVPMPDWFGALNRDFRYQLTCIGGFAPVFIDEEMTNNQFKIGGGKAGMKISWQVTGTRQDAWANAHRIPVEEVKPKEEHGTYLHPELFGAPEEKGVLWATAPKAMQHWKEARSKAAAHGPATTGKP
jgi:trimeric autotransporter adhesin